MPTSYSDQFFTMDPANPPGAGTDLTTRQLTLVDQNNDGDIDRFNNDSVGGLDVVSSWPGDKVTIKTLAGDTITYTGTTFYLSDSSAVFTPTDGQTLKVGEFVSSTFVTTQGSMLVKQLGPPCFVSGSRILTPSGPRPVETLRAGDLVETLDKGPVPLLTPLSRTLTKDQQAQNPRLCPVFVPFEAVTGRSDGPCLIVSPQHRILIRSKIAERMFGESEVLAPAIQLVGFGDIRQSPPMDAVTYVHLILDHHAVIIAEGIPCESLLLASQSLAMMERETLLKLGSVLAPDRCVPDETGPQDRNWKATETFVGTP